MHRVYKCPRCKAWHTTSRGYGGGIEQAFADATIREVLGIKE